MMLQVNISNKQYRSFVQYAIKTCDSLSLIYEKTELDKTKYIFQEFHDCISEYMLFNKSVEYHPDTGTSFQNSDIVYYKCNDDINYALKIANGVFEWNGVNLPEELCIYRNNEKWFVCICHEKLSFIYNETKDDINFLKENKIEYFY